MKLNILGTGAILSSHPSPSHLIDEKILVDISNGSIKSIKRLNISVYDIDILLITHFHGDHYFDLPFLLLDIGREKRDKDFYIVGPTGIVERVETLFNLAFPGDYEKVLQNSRIKFIDLHNKNFQTFNIHKYTINAYKMDHGKIEAYGYTICDNQKTIGFSGDTLLCNNVEKIIENSDLSIIDFAFVDSKSGHMGLNDILFLKEKFNKKLIYPTHMSDDARQEASKFFTIFDDFSEINL